VVELCATRGGRASAAKSKRQRKREIHYALDCRRGSVFLVRRGDHLRLMPGMWELPEIEPGVAQLKRKGISRLARNNDSGARNGKNPLFTVRHSITVTDYTVRVWQMPAPAAVEGTWVALEKAQTLALTGLARKILQRASNIRDNVSII
jgi:adenine-specific DNA glycosylase